MNWFVVGLLVVVVIALAVGWLAVLRFGGGNHGGMDE